MHSHVRGSHRANIDDNNFNSFRGIPCEGQTPTDRQTDRHTDTTSSMLPVSKFLDFENKKTQ